MFKLHYTRCSLNCMFETHARYIAGQFMVKTEYVLVTNGSTS